MRTLRSISMLAVVASFAAACAPPDPPPAAYPAPTTTRIELRPETRVVVRSDRASDGDLAPGEWSTAAPAEPDVLVTTARKLDRPTEVVGVIDAHEPSGRQDAAFALIRERAREMGADAVVGVEFHHGEGEGEPTHLSGLAVRYLDRTP